VINLTNTPANTPREDQTFERKSLRVVTGSSADFPELAKDCVCFANGTGGRILVGIEEGELLPPPGQRIDPGLIDRVRKRIGELTVNVQVLPEVQGCDNGGEVLVLAVPRATGVASTSDGRYYLRVGDTCQPVVGDDVLRLATERPSTPWETLTHLGVPVGNADGAKTTSWCAAIRASDRVKASVREKSDSELLEHYGLAVGGVLTNLGVLLIGKAADRARLGSAPVVQAIRLDAQGKKVGKLSWDDHTLSPIELLDAIWNGVPDFRESYEVPDGMFRTTIPAFEESVVRELLVNALVHRPYTQRGDIYLNLDLEKLEVVNPGRLPLGVTPKNILHASRRRNDGLARVFHDLKLMEREGSGFDLMYERLLASGRGAPTPSEGPDSVHVVVPRRILHPGVIRFLGEADRKFSLSQREKIALGLLAPTEGLSAVELAEQLELNSPPEVGRWLDRLINLGLVQQAGRTKATRYFVPPDLLKASGLDHQTTLKRVSPHRLRALVLEDLERYPDSAISDIHRRIGSEIAQRTIKRSLDQLTLGGRVKPSGENRGRTYRLAPDINHPPKGG
jgi:ATP-dependent DNA helicase RecG